MNPHIQSFRSDIQSNELDTNLIIKPELKKHAKNFIIGIKTFNTNNESCNCLKMRLRNNEVNKECAHMHAIEYMKTNFDNNIDKYKFDKNMCNCNDFIKKLEQINCKHTLLFKYVFDKVNIYNEFITSDNKQVVYLNQNYSMEVSKNKKSVINIIIYHFIWMIVYVCLFMMILIILGLIFK